MNWKIIQKNFNAVFAEFLENSHHKSMNTYMITFTLFPASNDDIFRGTLDNGVSVGVCNSYSVNERLLTYTSPLDYNKE